jgi:hypothetical protein
MDDGLLSGDINALFLDHPYPGESFGGVLAAWSVNRR